MLHYFTHWVIAICFVCGITAQSNSSKRGITYQATSNDNDYNIFISRSSVLTWYYNWSPYPVSEPSSFSRLSFAPLLHGLSNLQSNIRQLRNLPSTSTHLLSFNEPDGSLQSGGSDVQPPAAAAAYVQYINPLSVQNGGRWQISWPSTTGTYNGLQWLRAFNESCFKLNRTHGCVHDFVATHFYGDFPALASWLGQLNDYHNGNTTAGFKFWITEVALPQASAAATEVMMNTTLSYLDQLPYVERYSWFGFTRQNRANQWTGDGVSLLNNNGGLTQLGATYLGGSAKGYTAGMSAASNTAAHRTGGTAHPVLLLALLFASLGLSTIDILA